MPLKAYVATVEFVFVLKRKRFFLFRGVFSWEGEGTLPKNGYKPSQELYWRQKLYRSVVGEIILCKQKLRHTDILLLFIRIEYCIMLVYKPNSQLYKPLKTGVGSSQFSLKVLRVCFSRVKQWLYLLNFSAGIRNVCLSFTTSKEHIDHLSILLFF